MPQDVTETPSVYALLYPAYSPTLIVPRTIDLPALPPTEVAIFFAATDAVVFAAAVTIEPTPKLNTVPTAPIPIHVEYEEFLKGEFTLPAICCTVNKYGQGHYVVISKISKGHINILDPALGKRKVTPEEFKSEFTGKMVLVAPKKEFTRDKEGRRNLLSQFLDLLKPQKGLFATAIVIGFILTLLGIVSSFFYRILIDDILGNSLENQVTVFFIAYLLINLTNIALSTIRQHIVLHLSQKISIPLMLGYFGHIMRLPMKFFGTRKRGDIITRYQDAGTVVDVASGIIMSVVIDLVFAIVSGVFLFMISAKLFVITIVITILSAILIYAFLPAYKKLNRESMEAQSRLNSNVIESLSNIETIKTNSAESSSMEKTENRLIDTLKIAFRGGIIGNVQGTLSSIVSTIGGLVMLWIGTLSVLGGEMTLGVLMSFYALSEFFTGPIGRFISLQIEIQEADIALKRLNEIFDVKEESETRSGDIIPESLYGDIELSNITFKYGSRKPIIDGLNLTIHKGEKIAIIGESGSGKTTLGKIITGLWAPEEGEIKINGYDTSELNIQAMRSHIAYVQQNTELFSGTITENLRLSKPDATFEEIRDACEKAECMEFIGRMPSRYDTYLEEAGANLSGGERQRLSIARALLKDSEIMIMDEATSSLDMMSEVKVHDHIFNDNKERTLIIIAHRLSAVRKCDRIIVMDKGKIIEDGTHDSLLALNGEYAKLWNSQFTSSPAPITKTTKPTIQIDSNDDVEY